MNETLDSIFNTLSDKIVIAHAKDVKRTNVSTGVYREKRMRTKDEALSHTSPNIPLIIEHLTEEDVPALKNLLTKC